MKRITLYFLLLFTQTIFAQFDTSTVQYYIGEGTETAYFIVDFNDDSETPSYVWGFRFNEADGLTAADLFYQIGEADPNLTIDSSDFLNDISYNEHDTSLQEYDYWSTWNGDSFETMVMNGSGLSGLVLEDSRWYGASYGWMFISAEPTPPSLPVPAIDPTVLSNSNSQKVEFKVYPNPTADYLNILTEEQIIEATIFDINGKQTLKSNEKRLDISNLTSGIYLIEVVTNSGKAIEKFIKQ
nr:T9SS type A sorting domain-containing protein [uncultured Flavobacterium sp.]